jgi:hypothetical protein
MPDLFRSGSLYYPLFEFAHTASSSGRTFVVATSKGFYYRHGLHSGLGYRSPADFEEATMMEGSAA